MANDKSFRQLISDVVNARSRFGDRSEEHMSALEDLYSTIEKFMNDNKQIDPERLKTDPRYSDYRAAEQALKSERLSDREIKKIKDEIKAGKKPKKKKSRPGTKDGRPGTFQQSDQMRIRSTPFGKILSTTEQGTRTTGISLGKDTKVVDRVLMSLMRSAGLDPEKAAKYRQEVGAREVVDKKTGEVKLTRKIGGLGIEDFAANVLRRQGIQGVGPLKQNKSIFVPDPIPLKDGYSFHIDSKGTYHYEDKDGTRVPGSVAVSPTSNVTATKESAPSGLRGKPTPETIRFRLPTTAKDRVKGSVLKSLGIDINAVNKYEVETGVVNKYGELLDREGNVLQKNKDGKYIDKKGNVLEENEKGQLVTDDGTVVNPGRSRLGRLYGRLNATRVVQKTSAKSEELPTPTSNKPTKTRKRKSKSKQTDEQTEYQTTEDESTSATDRDDPKYRRVPTTAADRVKGSVLKSLGIDIGAMNKYEVEHGIVNKYGEFLNENGEVVDSGKRSRIGALYSRLNKWEKIGGSKPGSADSKNIEAAVKAFTNADRTLKQTTERAAQEATIGEAQSEPVIAAPQSSSPQQNMSVANLLAEMLPDITKQVVDLTELLEEQGDKIHDKVSKAEDKEKEREHQSKKATKPRLNLSSLKPKADSISKVAKAATAIGGSSLLAGDTRPQGQPQLQAQKQPSGPSMLSSIGKTISDTLSDISDSLFGLEPAGNSAHAGQAMAYFMSQGWTKQQAAAIVGTMQVESGKDLDPNAFNPAGGGHGAVGIAQWRGARQLGNFPKQALGVDTLRGTTFEQQLQYVQWELTHNYKSAASKLREANTVDDAVSSFLALYEGVPGNKLAQRIVNAKALAGEKIEDTSLMGQAMGAFSSGTSFIDQTFGYAMDAVKAVDVLQFTQNTGDMYHFMQLPEGFRNALISAGVEFLQLTGSKIQINSARRSASEQNALRESGKYAVVASAENSPHVKGFGVDIGQGGNPIAVRVLGNHGIHWQGIPNDPWHYNYHGSMTAPAPRPEPRSSTKWDGAWDKAIQRSKIKVVVVPVPAPSAPGSLLMDPKKKSGGGGSLGVDPGQKLRAHW